jgi:hypothetical protein
MRTPTKIRSYPCRSARAEVSELSARGEVLAGTKRAGYPVEEMSERHDHGKNFRGKDRINLCAKSFISQMRPFGEVVRRLKYNANKWVARYS